MFVCKYIKTKGIVVKTAEQRDVINKVILESRNKKSSSSTSFGNYNPSLWDFRNSKSRN